MMLLGLNKYLNKLEEDYNSIYTYLFHAQLDASVLTFILRGYMQCNS